MENVSQRHYYDFSTTSPISLRLYYASTTILIRLYYDKEDNNAPLLRACRPQYDLTTILIRPSHDNSTTSFCWYLLLLAPQPLSVLIPLVACFLKETCEYNGKVKIFIWTKSVVTT